LFLLLLATTSIAAAQTVCSPTPLYSLCELVFELPEAAAKAHPNPYASVSLQAEFRSPKHRTYLMPGFWDGGRRMVIRFSPVDAGEWNFRITSNVADFDDKLGKFTATPAAVSGFIRPANVHHWITTESKKPHLWMGDTNYRFAFMDRALFERFVDTRAIQKFNHIRGAAIGWPEDASKVFRSPDEILPEHFQELDGRIRFMNEKGIIADLILGGDENHLANQFPRREQRERYVRYMVARYAAMNVTWQGVQEFEEYKSGRELLQEVGLLLKKYDPYPHPRTTHTVSTSAPLLADGWMDHVLYQSSDDNLGAIEHQLYQVPQVNSEFAYEDSGAGKSHPHHVDTETFRKRLWNATMNGQYVTFGNTGTYGGRKFIPDAKYLDSPGARQMTAWFDFFSRTRYWDLEPYFDVDGGRALALEGIEYIVYVEKPGPVEILLVRHGYDVQWFNPATGESIKQKDFKGERFAAEPPDKSRDWVLHISREGRKEDMLRSYIFESRPVPIQEVEQNPQKVPYEIAEPAGDQISMSKPPSYTIKLKRETRATRSMMYLWTGDVVAAGHGYRVIGSGREGKLRIPKSMFNDLPAVINVRVSALNANGKAYSLDKIYRLVP
jgi:hypothetical protein